MLFLKEQEHAIIFNSVDNKLFFNLKVSVPNRPGTNARCGAKMAEGNTIRSSASVAISDNKTSAFDNKIEKSTFLFYDA